MGSVVVVRRASVLGGAVAGVVLAALGAPAGAADGTWTGVAGDGLWATPGNWVGDAVPGSVGTTNSADVAVFTGTPASVAVTVDANRNVAGILFDNIAINGDDPASLPYAIGSTDGNALYLSNGGVTRITSTVTYNQGSSTSAGSNQSINAPTLLVGPTYTLTSDSASNVGLVLRGSMKPVGGVATTLTLNGSTNTGVSLSPSQVIGAVTDGAGGEKMGIVKEGPGSWELRGANTYSGDTVVKGGVLRFVNQTAGVEAASPNTHLIIENGGKIRFSTNGAVSPGVEIRPGGLLDTSNSGITVNYKVESGPAFYFNFSSGTATAYYTNSAPVVLTGTTAGQGGIKMTATPSQAAVNFGGTGSPLDLGTVLRPVDVGITGRTDVTSGAAVTYDMRLRGPISGNGGGILKVGPGILQLANGTQTWTGTLEVREGQLLVNTSGAMNGNQTLLVSGGDFRVNSNHTQTFGSVTISKGLLSRGNSTSVVRSNTFTFNVGAGDTTQVDSIIADNNAAATLTKNGEGTATITAANTYTGALTVNAGTMVIGNGSKTSFFASTGGADVRGGTLVFDFTGGSSSAGTIKGLLADSYNNFTPHFSGGTIRSSTASSTRALGYRDDVTSFVVMSTYYGDLNLDGRVNGDDFALIDRHVALNGMGSAGEWVNGDLNYDNVVNANDYMLIDATYGASGVPHAAFAALVAERRAEFGETYAQSLMAAVPEPGSALVVGGGLVFAGRRRRSR